MDQLNNTEQTTSNIAKPKTKSEKKAKPKKKKAPVKISREKVMQIINIVKDIVIGAILGSGAFFALISEFGLKWSHKHWADGSFTGGLIRAWNIVCDTLAGSDGVFLTKLMGEGDSSGQFLTFILMLFVVVSILAVMSRVKWLALAYPIICILPTVLWGLHSSVISICVMALGIMLFIINSDIPRLKFNFRGLIYALLMAFIAFVIISIPGISKLADRPDSVDEIRENITQDISAKYYGENPLHDGDLMAKRRKTGEGTALKVTMDEPQPMYLRGFVGDVLNDEGWEPLSGATYYNQVNFVYWMHKNGFNGLGQLGQSAELAKQGGKKKLNANYFEKINHVKVENVSANKKYAYVPYEITIDGVADTKNWGDNFLTGGKYKRIKEYSFDTHENDTDKWTDYASMLFSNKVTPVGQRQYMENESYYNTYVYEKYTYMSPEERDVMSIAMPAAGDQTRGHVEYNEAIKSVKELISYNFTYTDILSGYMRNSSALTNIFDTQAGYDSQLATAAVMMFRYYGIPARYVEGYLVTEDDIFAGKKTIDVPRSNAHAWCEIYVDGLGFVPIEVCEEFDGLMPEADFTKGIQTKQKKPNPDMSTVNEKDPNIINDDNTGSSKKMQNKMPKKGLIIVGVLVGLILLALIILGIRKLIMAIRARCARNRLFKTGDPKEAVSVIYGLMLDKDLPIDEETRALGNKATYSEHNISESDRIAMLAKLNKFTKKNKVDKKLAKARHKIENSKLSDAKKKKRLEILEAKFSGKKKPKKKKHSKANKKVDPKKQAKQKKQKNLQGQYSSYERKQVKNEEENQTSNN